MSSLSATQSDGYYLPPEYFESGSYQKVSRNQFAAEKYNNGNTKAKAGHNQWLKHGVVRFELPEKVVCLGCKHSIGRGTRFNAKKHKTDQSYFSTPIFEFSLSCRNCKEPWVIRTDPKERGFRYVSGVKRQAGRDKNLVEDNAARADSIDNNNGPLESLEQSLIATTRSRTEREELEGLLHMNRNAYAEDADTNARIRSRLRKDRREKRQRKLGGQKRGWNATALLPTSDGDRLLAKEACYGAASQDERKHFANLRRSSIFAKKQISSQPQQQKLQKVPLSSKQVSLAKEDLSASIPRKTKLKLSDGVLSIAEQNKTGDFDSNPTPLSFQDLMGAYGSSEDEDD